MAVAVNVADVDRARPSEPEANASVAASLPAAWRPLTRIAFRFVVVYFSLYVVTTQMLQAMIPRPVPGFPPLERLPPVQPLLMWTAKQVFAIAETPVVLSGSGDKYLNWIAVAWLLTAAAIATVAWSILDRRRRAYP